MRLWAENVPGFDALVWACDMPNLRIKFALDWAQGKDTTLAVLALRNAPRTHTGSLKAQPLVTIEGDAVKALERHSAAIVEAARITFHPSMAKHKRPPK